MARSKSYLMGFPGHSLEIEPGLILLEDNRGVWALASFTRGYRGNRGIRIRAVKYKHYPAGRLHLSDGSKNALPNHKHGTDALIYPPNTM